MPPASADARGAHLYLVGLAGSGKSTVGRGLAARLERPFIDLDEEIIRRMGMSVGEIFRLRGESHFRSLERELTRELALEPASVVAPGAGWIMTPGVLEIARPAARLIYLRVRPETALGRVGSNRANRPLLNRPDALEELNRQLVKRGPAYEMADLVVDSETLSLQEVIDLIVASAATAG